MMPLPLNDHFNTLQQSVCEKYGITVEKYCILRSSQTLYKSLSITKIIISQ